MTREELRDQYLVDRVKTLAALRFGVTVSEINGKSKLAEIVRARHVAVCVLHRRGMSASAIGRAFKRDHTTILHAVTKPGLPPPWGEEYRRQIAEVDAALDLDEPQTEKEFDHAE